MPNSPVQDDPNNSWAFDRYKISSYTEVRNLVTALYTELIENDLCIRNPVPGSEREKDFKNALSIVILNVFAAYSFDKTKYIGYSRGENHYRMDERYLKLHISYSQMIAVVDKLAELNYIEKRRWQNNRSTGYRRRSRMRASLKIIELIEKYDVDATMIERDDSMTEVILLKDESKTLTTYEDTLEIRRMRKSVDKINHALKQSFISLYMSDEMFNSLKKKLKKTQKKKPVEFEVKRLHRTFNDNSWNRGGRFYGGWWQNLPKMFRKFIVLTYPEHETFEPIDVCDARTVELDYKAQHATILFHKEGLDFGESDPFVFDEFPLSSRAIFKASFYMMLNAYSRRSAMGAVNIFIRKLHDNNEYPKDVALTPKDIIATLEDKRSDLSEHFYTGIGLELMNIDSQIAEKVMLEMLKFGQSVLPIHDSFIINSQFENELHECMEKAFVEVVGTQCEISKKRSFKDWKRRRPDVYEKFYGNDTFYTFDEYHEQWLNMHDYNLAYYKEYGLIWRDGELLKSASNIPI